LSAQDPKPPKIARHRLLMKLVPVLLLAGFVALGESKSCATKTTCKMKLANVAKNDLHKGGELRYSDVCTVNGKKIDLVVTASSGYTGKSFRNGLSGQYGNINLSPGSSADFTFSFSESGSSTSVKLDSLYFTVFDIDAGVNKMGKMMQTESVTFSGFKSFSVGANCELHRQISPGQSTFTATTHGVGKDNPTDPAKLTAQQTSRSVTFLYTSVSSFKAKFAVLGRKNKKGGRNFLFAGESEISQSCSVPVCRPAGNCKLNFQQIKTSNLGGKGPQGGEKELLYGSVCKVSGQTLDLAVTATSPYLPANSAKNGISGAYGVVNLANSQKANFLFSFYKAGTKNPFTLSSTSFTIFDIDSGSSGEAEVVTASGFSSYTSGNNTELKVEPSPGTLKLTSTTQGYGSDNPKDPMALTPKQIARSVTLVFDDVSSFPLSFQITGGPSDKGRNLLFAGDSSLNAMCTSSSSSPTKLFEDLEDSDLASLEKNTGMVPLMLVALASGLTCFFVGFAVQRRRSSAHHHVKDVPFQEIE